MRKDKIEKIIPEKLLMIKNNRLISSVMIAKDISGAKVTPGIATGSEVPEKQPNCRE